MSEFGGLWKHEKTQHALYILGLGNTTLLQLALLGESEPKFPIGTTKCTKYKCTKQNWCMSTKVLWFSFVWQVHTKHKPYVCKHCNESFYEGERLQYHLAKHSKVKSHACPRCGQAFYMKYALNKHMVLHQPYSHMCDKCGRTFPRLDQMRIHIKVCAHGAAAVTDSAWWD